MKKISTTLNRISLPSFTVIVSVVCVLAVGFAVAYVDGTLKGCLAGGAAFAIFSIPNLPFSFSPNFGILPPLLAKMISTTSEISGEDLAIMFTELKAQVNALLSGLPPVEQFEAAPDLVYGLRTMRNAAAQLLEIQDALGTTMQKYATQAQAKAAANAEAKLIEKGEYVKKTDAETARDTAVNAAKEEVRTEVKTAGEVKEKVAAARAKMVTDKVATQSAVDALPEEFFKTEGFEDRVTKLKARLATLVSKKLDKSEDFVAEMAALGFDEAGQKTFDARIKSVESLVSSRSSRPAPKVVAPAAIPAEAAEEGKKVTLIF